jgi:hypothetical protein
VLPPTGHTIGISAPMKIKPIDSIRTSDILRMLFKKASIPDNISIPRLTLFPDQSLYLFKSVNKACSMVPALDKNNMPGYCFFYWNEEMNVEKLPVFRPCTRFCSSFFFRLTNELCARIDETAA